MVEHDFNPSSRETEADESLSSRPARATQRTVSVLEMVGPGRVEPMNEVGIADFIQSIRQFVL